MEQSEQSEQKKLVLMLTRLVECKAQLIHDFSGDNRDWHLSRVDEMYRLASQLFPHEIVMAIDEAGTPSGGYLLPRVK